MIYCTKCHDVRKIHLYDFLEDKKTHCTCGESWGYYIDKINAFYGGLAIPLGINNMFFKNAISNQPEEGDGKIFESFVIPKKCKTFIKE